MSEESYKIITHHPTEQVGFSFHGLNAQPFRNIVFCADPYTGGGEVGRLEWDGKGLRFTGNADVSAQIFFDSVIKLSGELGAAAVAYAGNTTNVAHVGEIDFSKLKKGDPGWRPSFCDNGQPNSNCCDHGCSANREQAEILEAAKKGGAE